MHAKLVMNLLESTVNKNLLDNLLMVIWYFGIFDKLLPSQNNILDIIKILNIYNMLSCTHL